MTREQLLAELVAERFGTPEDWALEEARIRAAKRQRRKVGAR